MSSYTTICLRKLSCPPVDLVSLALPSYGSLELARLETLSSELLHVARNSNSRTMLLDLGQRKLLGAGFLSVVERLRRALTDQRHSLILSGDDGGLLATAGWTRRVPHYPDLTDAVNISAGRRYCEPAVSG